MAGDAVLSDPRLEEEAHGAPAARSGGESGQGGPTTYARVIGTQEGSPVQIVVRRDGAFEAGQPTGADPLAATLEAARRCDQVTSISILTAGARSSGPFVPAVASMDEPGREERVPLPADEIRRQIAEGLTQHVVRRLYGLSMAVSSLQSRAIDPSVQRGLADVVTELDLAIAELRSSIFDLDLGGEAADDPAS